jgi:hypothetical protein
MLLSVFKIAYQSAIGRVNYLCILKTLAKDTIETELAAIGNLYAAHDGDQVCSTVSRCSINSSNLAKIGTTTIYGKNPVWWPEAARKQH